MTPANIPGDAEASRALRVLFVGPERHGSDAGALARALRRLVHVVAHVDEAVIGNNASFSLPLRATSRVLRRAYGAELGKQILSVASTLEPQLCVVYKGNLVYASVLEELNRRGVYCVNVYPDVSITAHGPEIPECIPLYDHIFTTKSFGIADMREQLGVTRSELLLHGYDPDLHRPVPPSDADREALGADCTFIGTWSPKKEEYLRHLVQSRPDVKLRIWGWLWADRVRKDDALWPSIEGRTLEGDLYTLGIVCSKINLGLLSEQREGSSSGDQTTARTFQIPATGAFMLHERTDELLECFEEGREVACFESPAEMVEVVRHYLAHEDERDRIREAGYRRAARDHCIDVRARRVIEHYRQHAAGPGGEAAADGSQAPGDGSQS